jgi:anti-sigma regulatory factor (Ser/Thr protein kinase)
MGRFHHEALFYASDDEYLAATVPEIRTALDRDGAAAVAVPDSKRRLLRRALGADANRVHFADMARLGRNPACIIPAWRQFLRDAGPGPAIGIGEPVWPGRTDAELVECSRHEALLNLAFDGGRAWRLLCPYDEEALAPGVLDEACRNHPHVRRDGLSADSDGYGGHDAILAWEDALPAPAGTPVEQAFTRRDLPLVRQFVTETARRAGLDADRLSDLVLAVSELAGNTLRHAGGSGKVRTWRQGATFMCEVEDEGRITDPLVGRERPPDLHGGGRGLWMVNQLCDLVQVRTSDAGNVIRLHMRLSSA